MLSLKLTKQMDITIEIDEKNPDKCVHGCEFYDPDKMLPYCNLFHDCVSFRNRCMQCLETFGVGVTNK